MPLGVILVKVRVCHDVSDLITSNGGYGIIGLWTGRNLRDLETSKRIILLLLLVIIVTLLMCDVRAETDLLMSRGLHFNFASKDVGIYKRN
jgi:hypothetical protein